MKIKITLRFKQIRADLYRLAGMTNTTDFIINSDYSKKEVDKLINSGYQCSFTKNS
jgi:hypothetical protein